MQILHGDDTTNSRNKLVDLITQAKFAQREIIQLDGRKCTLTDIKQALESQSLFGQDKLVTIENLFSRPDSNEKKNIINYFSKSLKPSTYHLIIWESRQLTPTQLKPFPKNNILEFKLPAVIFQFLDIFSPRNPSQTLKLLNQVLFGYPPLTKGGQGGVPPEMLFGMLIKRLRYLIAASHSPQTLAKFKELRDWQQRKILTQARQFTTAQLLSLNQKFIETDFCIKTSKTNLDLSTKLQLILTRTD